MRRHAVAFAAALLAMPAVAPAGGADAGNKARLQELRSQIEALREDIERTHGERNQTRADLQEAERAVAAAARDLQRTEAGLKAGAGRLQALGEEQTGLHRQLDRARHGLARQVRAAYSAGRQEYLKLLLNQQDPETVSRVLTYYRYLTRARTEEIAGINASLARLDAVGREIDAERAELERLRQGQLAYQQRLEETRNKRAEILARLDRELAQKKSEVGALRADEQRLAKLLEGLSLYREELAPASGAQEKFTSTRGQLRLPAAGPISARFGALKDGGPLLWQGLLIGGREGEEVRAVYGGRVAFAEWFGGLGLLVILDHGEGYMSLYGHNQVLYTEVGDWVETGQKIASVGSSGGLRSAGLYFEIRENGEPRDPLQWCRARFAARP